MVQLAITALLALVVLAACSNDGLSDYLDRVDHVMDAHYVDHVMDAHYNEFTIADAAFDDFQAYVPHRPSSYPSSLIVMLILLVALNRYERVSLVYMERMVVGTTAPRRGVAIPRVDP